MDKKGRNIQERAFRFACRVVKLHGHLCAEKAAYRSLSQQLLRAATSIGANLEEADAGQSRADFSLKSALVSKRLAKLITGSVFLLPATWFRLIESQT